MIDVSAQIGKEKNKFLKIIDNFLTHNRTNENCEKLIKLRYYTNIVFKITSLEIKSSKIKTPRCRKVACKKIKYSQDRNKNNFFFKSKKLA